MILRPFAASALLLFAVPLEQISPLGALWTTPAILLASLLIAWGAESAQFFVGQAFALAILAWMQTLPEFAVEAVLAWKGQTSLLLANLTGALRLLTGLAWPMIYLTAAVVHRRRHGRPLRQIALDPEQSVEVIGLLLPLLYAAFIWWKHELHVYDAAILTAIYAAYLLALIKLPAAGHEGIDDLEVIPRTIVKASPVRRNLAIAICFLVGGTLIYFTAEPFLGSLVAVASAIGLPSFVVIQWFAPVVSEFPELASTFYFARKGNDASIALMNIVSSNINQWTLLMAMLPVVLSLGRGSLSSIPFDNEQRGELLLTICQSLVGMAFLLNMALEWWEALVLFLLFVSQFVLPTFLGSTANFYISMAFLLWTAFELVRIVLTKRQVPAWRCFQKTWRTHFRAG